MAGRREVGETLVNATVRRDVKKLRQLLEKRQVPVKKIIIFGSHARNLATPSSDIDLCVVCNSKMTADPKELQSHINCDAGLAGLNMDIVVTTVADLRTNRVSPILHEIRTYGIEI